MAQYRGYIFKTVVVGEGAVGKTALVTRFCTKTFKEQYIATIGANFMLKTVNLPDGTPVTIQAWDMSGQMHFRQIRKSFYAGAVGCIYVYEIPRTESLEALPNWKDEVDKVVPGIPAILLGNKADLEDLRSVTADQGQEMANQLGAEHFWETSAKKGTHVDEAFNKLAQMMYDYVKAREIKNKQE